MLNDFELSRGKILAILALGFLFLIIGRSKSDLLLFFGLLLIAVALFLLFRSEILRKEQVIEKWAILIENGNGKAEEIFRETGKSLKGSGVKLKIERKEIAPGIIKGILGEKRDFLVVKDKSYTLKPYQIFINARDYGENLDVSWYLTYRLSFFRALLSLIPFVSLVPKFSEDLDIFDLQDLTAYGTLCHHSTLKAVENLMRELNQDPSRIDRKTRGFLGIS